jgi:hypothetical protein
MATFFMPIELHNPLLSINQRWFFLEIEAQDACDATIEGNRIARGMFPDRRVKVSRWAAVPELPSVIEMEALRCGFARSRGKSWKVRSRAVDEERERLAA